MRERREEAPQDERRRECLATARRRCLAIVKNVFRHREAERRQRGIDDTVNDAVKLVFLPEEKDKKDQCLAGLFDDWRRDDGGECFTGTGAGDGADDELEGRVEKERAEGGDKCAPEESSGEHPERFAFVTIDPQDECDIKRDRNRGREKSENQGDWSGLNADQQQNQQSEEEGDEERNQREHNPDGAHSRRGTDDDWSHWERSIIYISRG